MEPAQAEWLLRRALKALPLVAAHAGSLADCVAAGDADCCDGCEIVLAKVLPLGVAAGALQQGRSRPGWPAVWVRTA